MLNDNEIREAVELGKIIQAGNGDMIKQESKDKMLDTFMTFSQAYLVAKMPKNKNYINKEDYRAYEEMLQDIEDNYILKLDLAKKLEGLEEVIRKAIAKNTNDVEFISEISTAIRKRLMGREK